MMQYCSVCGGALHPGEPFCGRCGASTARMRAMLQRKTCTQCGYADWGDPGRCPRCGGKMRSPESQDTRRRRVWIAVIASVLGAALLIGGLVWAVRMLRNAAGIFWDSYGNYDYYGDDWYYDYYFQEPDIIPTVRILWDGGVR